MEAAWNAKGTRTHVCGVRQSLLEGNQELLVEVCARSRNHRERSLAELLGQPCGFCFILPPQHLGGHLVYFS